MTPDLIPLAVRQHEPSPCLVPGREQPPLHAAWVPPDELFQGADAFADDDRKMLVGD